MSGPENDDERDEAMRAAIRVAERNRPEFLVRELRDTRPPPPWFRLWLADVLDPDGKSEFVARLTPRTLRGRGRPKATATALPGPENMVLVWQLVDISLRWLRSDAPLDPSIGPMLSRWFDPEERTFVKATIGRRRRGKPSRPSQRMVRAADYVVVHIRPDSNLKRLMAEAIKLHSRPAEPIARSKLYAYLKAHWPDLLPKASAARRSSRRKKIE